MLLFGLLKVYDDLYIHKLKIYVLFSYRSPCVVSDHTTETSSDNPGSCP